MHAGGMQTGPLPGDPYASFICSFIYIVTEQHAIYVYGESYIYYNYSLHIL